MCIHLYESVEKRLKIELEASAVQYSFTPYAIVCKMYGKMQHFCFILPHELTQNLKNDYATAVANFYRNG